MIKKYCDRCGVECEKLETVHIPTENHNNGSYSAGTIEVCPDCEKEYRKIEDVLIDFKITVYRKFFNIAVDKPIAKKPKPIPYVGGTQFFDCPYCDKTMAYKEYAYCPDCGQKLDWGENNE